MLKFIKENMSMITKFMLSHLVMAFLGIMVGLAVLVADKQESGFSLLAVLAGMLTVGDMCFMHYDDSFFAGVKDGIKARADGEKVDTFKGLKIALIAYIPVFIVGVIVIVFHIVNPEIQAVPLLLYYFFQGSYLPLYALQQYVGIVGYVLITLIPAIVASTLGYAIGSKDKTLRGMMGMNVKPPFDGPLERKPKNKH